MSLEVLSYDSENSLERQAYVERYLNKNFLSLGLAKFESMDARYWPAAKEKSFKIKSFKIPRSEVLIITSDPSEDIKEHFLGDKEYVRFHAHPDILTNRIDHLGKTISYLDVIDKSEVWGEHDASPTGSLRTLIVLGNPSYHVKCHFPRMLTPFYIKSFGSRTIHQSVRLTQYLKEYSHPKFAFLPEVIGVTFPSKDGEKKGWGFSIRETKPYPPRNDGEWDLYPLFGLYSKDINNPERPVLLQTLYDKYRETNNGTFVDFLMKTIIEPMIETWVGCLNKTGILLEKHGQNLLFEVNRATMELGRPVDRDFEIHVDIGRRKKLGLSIEYIHPEHSIGDGDDETKEVYSFVYDQAIGFGLGELAKLADQLYGTEIYTPSKELSKRTSEFFGLNMPDHADYFPRTTYEISREMTGINSYKKNDTGKLPLWRPVFD